MSNGWGTGPGGAPDGGQGPWQGPGRSWQPPPTGPVGEPDWNALADARDRGRRRKVLAVAGGVLAAGAIAAIVAVSVARSGGSTAAKTTASPTAQQETEAPTAAPSFPEVTQPPPPDPLSFISDAAKDTAPLDAGTLFPGKRLTIGEERTYTKATTGDSRDCAAVTQGGLGQVLASHGCTRVLRATYQRAGTAVTVGVAVFDTKADAEKVREAATGNIAALPGGGVGTFCRPVACWRTANAVGRYAYFTIAGPSDNTAAGEDDGTRGAGRDLATFAFNQLVARGTAAAAAG